MSYIELEGQKNARDLGGIVTMSGKHIRPRRLIRSGRINKLTPDDVTTLLAKCHLRTVIDFRSPKEAMENADPSWGIVEHFEIPVLSDNALGFSMDPTKSVLDSLMAMAAQPDFTPQEYMKDVYTKFINDAQAQRAYRHFFDLLLEKGNGCLLYHCNGGKDRTGLATVFLLTALGVTWQKIYEDYMETNVYMRPLLDEYLKKLPGQYQTEKDKDTVRMRFLADGNNLQIAREEMCKIAGTPLYYLQNVLGVDEGKMERLQKLYLV